MTNLTTRYLGLTLKNPLVASASRSRKKSRMPKNSMKLVLAPSSCTRFLKNKSFMTASSLIII